jgi:sugar O-acyltransferase (sialic acid O-acetyltransferase NeuD family)
MNDETVPCFVYGTGGHAKVVVDAYRRAGGIWAGCFDDTPSRVGVDFAGMRVSAPSPAATHAARRVHIAVGHNPTRHRLARRILDLGDTLLSVVHPFASVAASARSGDGTFVAASAVIGPDASVGLGCIVNHGAVIDHDCEVGDWSHIAPGAVLGGGVSIGVSALIGAGAVVLPGVKLGDDVIVGAGAVVRGDVASGCTVVGVPAKQI